MNGSDGQRVSVELTPDEARLVIAALRQFEPYWPSGLDELTRAELLAGLREAIDRVTTSFLERPTGSAARTGADPGISD